MGISTKELFQIAGFNSDQVSGFQAQVASGRYKREVLWPEHLRGKRTDDFRYGARIARYWLAMRRGYAKARRAARAKDFREIGMTTNILPGHADRKKEQLECLRSVLKNETPRKPSK